jgi:hypothetical protein
MSESSGNWRAIETESFIGKDRVLVVTGMPKGTSRGETAFLLEALPPGINEKILVLDLHFVADPEHGGSPVVWGKKIGPRQYTDVTIRGDSGGDITIPVQEVHS